MLLETKKVDIKCNSVFLVYENSNAVIKTYHFTVEFSLTKPKLLIEILKALVLKVVENQKAFWTNRKVVAFIWKG